jgi:endonuclease/exonuclease/phosphatase family metal-dependent hydrolase
VLGEFTGWEASPIALNVTDEGSGLLEATVVGLTPGIHAYKFLIDGAWTHDPANRLHRDDGVGGRNSIFVVGEPSNKVASLRVGSLNLHTYQEASPLDRLEDVALGFSAFETDVLLLQEVGEHVSDRSRPNAGEVLCAHLRSFTGKPWHHAWFEAHRGFDVYREGLSVLSLSPLHHVSKIQLSTGPLARLAVSAVIELEGGPLRLVSVHTSWNQQTHAAAEVGVLLDALETTRHGAERGVLVAGDFNGGPRSAQVQRMLVGGFGDVGAQLGETRSTMREAPQERIDYQFLRSRAGERSIRAHKIWRIFDESTPGFHPKVSDHTGLLGEYEFT